MRTHFLFMLLNLSGYYFCQFCKDHHYWNQIYVVHLWPKLKTVYLGVDFKSFPIINDWKQSISVVFYLHMKIGQQLLHIEWLYTFVRWREQNRKPLYTLQARSTHNVLYILSQGPRKFIIQNLLCSRSKYYNMLQSVIVQ